ncbi:polysaccharide deacetylase [Ochrobactrum sp. XJ1]|nr:polysaccharide deacetylase [Ochrobactrum sp. XJ1]
MAYTSKGFPLMLTFDLDCETMWTARDPEATKRPILMSQGAYGWKVGVWRVMDVLRKFGVKSTFFVPGQVVEAHQEVIDALLKDGHEIAHHSHTHRWIVNLSPEEELEEMEKGYQAILKATGKAPRGWRSPAAEVTDYTMDLMLQYKFDYSSNFFDNDAPYMLKIRGKETNIVELPFRYILTDSPFFQFSKILPGRTITNPKDVLDIWSWEFDTLYAEDRMMVLACHPEFIGQPSGAKLLTKFLEYVTGHSGLWIDRCDAISDDMRVLLQSEKVA